MLKYYTIINDEEHYDRVIKHLNRIFISYATCMRGIAPDLQSNPDNKLALYYTKGDIEYCDMFYYENHGYIRRDICLEPEYHLPQELFDF